MKLSRLYTNRPSKFAPIDFNEGLSVVVAEIRRPEDLALNTHNLGKTTVGPLIDFCLLKKKEKSFFLFKHTELFQQFVFYLELALDKENFVTIRRAVNPGSRVAILRSSLRVPNADLIPSEEWDYWDLPFERAKALLDGMLGFKSLSPWDYRMLVGYLIRDQSDYGDVFKLGKFAGKHSQWKPFVAHLMGIPADLVVDLYEKKAAREKLDAQILLYGDEWALGEESAEQILADLEDRRAQVDANFRVLDSIDFGSADERASDTLVNNVDANIRALNERAYGLKTLISKLEKSIDGDSINFKISEARTLFEEAGVHLGGQLVKNYDQLIEFNRSITRERKAALRRQLKDAIDERLRISFELHVLQQERSRLYEFLKGSEGMEKLKVVSKENSVMQGEIVLLENRLAAVARLREMCDEQVLLAQAFNEAQAAVDGVLKGVRVGSLPRFIEVQNYFSEFIDNVLGQEAMLDIQLNGEGGLEFSASFVNAEGEATSESQGTSYRKLLCMAFDFAVLRSNVDSPFPRFVFHDGAFEQLDSRKKENLLNELRRYAALGIQPIITTLDSDIPPSGGGEGQVSIFGSEIVLSLHDDGDAGRLFRMPRW